jgi:hypothetical protein
MPILFKGFPDLVSAEFFADLQINRDAYSP